MRGYLQVKNSSDRRWTGYRRYCDANACRNFGEYLAVLHGLDVSLHLCKDHLDRLDLSDEDAAAMPSLHEQETAGYISPDES